MKAITPRMCSQWSNDTYKTKRGTTVKKKKLKKVKLSSQSVKKMVGDGGIHWHGLDKDNPESTEMDGSHKHLFIINGLPVWTALDGVHSHPVNLVSSRTGPENTRHKHMIRVGGTDIQTEQGGVHLHELGPAYGDSVDGTSFSGLHRHIIEIDGEDVQSLLPGDLLQSHIRKRVHLEIQSVHVSNVLFPDSQEAVQFIEDRGFIGRDVKKVDDGYSFRQLSRDRFKEETLKEIELSNGVKAIVGILDPEKMADAAVTFDNLKDVDPKEEMMREEQVAALARLKDAYVAMVGDMKDKAQKFIPILNQFVDLSDEFVKNEPFQVFLTEFMDSFNVLNSEIDRIDAPLFEAMAEKSKKMNFEDHLRTIEPRLERLSDIFYESEGFDNFGRLLKKNHNLFKQMILNLPLIREEGDGSPIVKTLNDFIDFNVSRVDEIDHLTVKDINKLRIADIEIETLRESESLNKTLSSFLKKFVSDERPVVLEFGQKILKSSVSIDKDRKPDVDICYNLDKGIPFPANSVDNIHADDYLQKLSDSKLIVSEAARVLKSGGELKMTVPSTNGQRAFLPCFKSLWNEEVVKYLVNDESCPFEIVENKTDLKDDGSSAILKVVLKKM